MRTWLSVVLAAVGIVAVIAAIWSAGPWLEFNETRPLASVSARVLLIFLALGVAAGLCWLVLMTWSRNRRAPGAVLQGSLTGDSDALVIKERIEAAIATLKRASKKRKFVKELPWYVVIGPSGAGKTSALANSGLNFPLSTSWEMAPLAGAEPTRRCEWWFAENAVVVDTPGRYFTHDAAPRSDRRSWLALLSLLKAYRPRQPISGVILVFSLQDLTRMEGPALDAAAAKVRDRLEEVRSTLQSTFPIYVLFTKVDLVPGFGEFVAGLDQDRRRQAWGARFDPALNAKDALERVPAEFESLVKRVAQEATDRLQEEMNPRARAAIFALPAELSLLSERVVHFIQCAFADTGTTDGPRLRGFYFAAGLPQSSLMEPAIDRRSGGPISPGGGSRSKGVFLHDLLAKLIFTEAGRSQNHRPAAWRQAMFRYGGTAAVVLVGLAGLAALGFSFLANRSMVATTGDLLDELAANAQSLLSSKSVADPDVENVMEVLQTLRYLPAGYDNRGVPTPLHETFGLSQRERLHSASLAAYGRALERLFRSRLLLQLEQTIRQNMSDPFRLYEPLKIYLILGGQAPSPDDELIVAWLRSDWERRYPGSSNREGRLELEGHLRAMLELDDAHRPSFELDRALVESAQRSLGRMSSVEWAEALIRSAAAAAGLRDFSPAHHAGREAELVFETISGDELTSLSVPGLYTHAGFNGFFLVQLASIAQRLVDEQWVIGNGGAQGLERELPGLGPELLARYARDFADGWDNVLDRLKFKSFSADRPQYVALSAAASPSSPIRQLFEAIARETVLLDTESDAPSLPAKAAEGLTRIGVRLPSGKSQSRAGAAFAGHGAQHPAVDIEAQFRPYHLLVSGPPGQRPIDVLIQNLHDIHQSLQAAAAVPGHAERANSNLQLQIANLRTNASRLPKALSRMVAQAASEFEGDAAETSITRLNQLLSESVTVTCEAAIAGRYPFAGASAQDVAMADFVKLFAPNGVLDRFFVQYVAPFVDFSGPSWQWKRESRLGRELSGAALKAFQMAAEIRDAFFPAGGSTPAVEITFTPTSVHGEVDIALLEVSGQVVQGRQGGNIPVTVTWPGVFSSGDASLSLAPELPGRESSIRLQGPWALKRLVDTASITSKEGAVEARFVIGGRDISYMIQTGSSANPLLLPALSAFRCPTQF